MDQLFLIASGSRHLNTHTFAPGTLLLDRYQIINFIAEGGMQEVYRCWDQTLNRHVALKTPKRGARDKRFRRGAEMGARINHPNVAATFDYYEDASITFMVEEYVVGSNLQKRLDDEFFFMDPSLAAHVIHQIAKGLFEAHRVGICHRDIKPSNIIVAPDHNFSRIALTDFGIAKMAEAEIAAEIALFDQDNSTLTSSQTLLGAVPYMAPECWRNWKDAGKAIDIWALGCIAFQLLSGNLPFGSGRNAIVKVVQAEMLGKVDLSKPAWFGQHANTKVLEQELWALIMACLQIDPALRHSAKQVMDFCDALCYANAPREVGQISSYGARYADGGYGKFGRITDTGGHQRYFHRSDFFGADAPASGQKVSFCMYPGIPDPRCSPILLLR